MTKIFEYLMKPFVGLIVVLGFFWLSYIAIQDEKGGQASTINSIALGYVGAEFSNVCRNLYRINRDKQ